MRSERESGSLLRQLKPLIRFDRPTCCFTLGHSTCTVADVSFPSPNVGARSLCEQ